MIQLSKIEVKMILAVKKNRGKIVFPRAIPWIISFHRYSLTQIQSPKINSMCFKVSNPRIKQTVALEDKLQTIWVCRSWTSRQSIRIIWTGQIEYKTIDFQISCKISLCPLRITTQTTRTLTHSSIRVGTINYHPILLWNRRHRQLLFLHTVSQLRCRMTSRRIFREWVNSNRLSKDLMDMQSQP